MVVMLTYFADQPRFLSKLRPITKSLVPTTAINKYLNTSHKCAVMGKQTVAIPKLEERYGQGQHLETYGAL